MRHGRLIRRAGQVLAIGGSADSWNRQAAAASLAAATHTRFNDGAIGAASHRTAARLFGFRTVDDEIDVSIRYPRRLHIPGAKVIRSRDLDVDDITWVDGVPTTTPERTIVDLGLIFPQHEVMRILRHAVATGLVNRRDVARMRLRTSCQGRDGTGILGQCLDDLPEQAEETESGIEVLFLELCEHKGLPAPMLQFPVAANGRSYRLDFAYPATKVFVEIDGDPHDEAIRIAKDGGRQNDLVAHGWTPIRLHHRQMMSSPDWCADVIRQVIGQDL